MNIVGAKKAKKENSIRGSKGHINIRISHSGSLARYRGDTRNHGLSILMWSFGPQSMPLNSLGSMTSMANTEVGPLEK